MNGVNQSCQLIIDFPRKSGTMVMYVPGRLYTIKTDKQEHIIGAINIYIKIK